MNKDVDKYIKYYKMNQRLQDIPDVDYEEAKQSLLILANYVQKMKNKEKNKYTQNCACTELKRIKQMIDLEKSNFF